MQSGDFVRINEDLDEGKTCCLCFGLEQGYNIIGVFTLIGAIFCAFLLAAFLAIGEPLLILIYGSLCLWSILIGAVWVKGFLARRDGDGKSFK